tara:strand:+ start:556 stop:729 length:174 start_codon:yes stop_codon:yes gene_type:complete
MTEYELRKEEYAKACLRKNEAESSYMQAKRNIGVALREQRKAMHLFSDAASREKEKE